MPLRKRDLGGGAGAWEGRSGETAAGDVAGHR